MRREEVTERMKELMPESDRQQLFPTHPPSPLPHDDIDPKEDREVVAQRNFAKACKDRGWVPVWHKTYKRSTANVGCPDFIVAAYSQTFWIEFKLPGEDLRPDQAAFRKRLLQNGVQMCVVYSAQEAVDLIESHA
jgi:hypothetical protein